MSFEAKIDSPPVVDRWKVGHASGSGCGRQTSTAGHEFPELYWLAWVVTSCRKVLWAPEALVGEVGALVVRIVLVWKCVVLPQLLLEVNGLWEAVSEKDVVEPTPPATFYVSCVDVWFWWR